LTRNSVRVGRIKTSFSKNLRRRSSRKSNEFSAV
jgi:hypothetical protein